MKTAGKASPCTGPEHGASNFQPESGSGDRPPEAAHSHLSGLPWQVPHSLHVAPVVQMVKHQVVSPCASPRDLWVLDTSVSSVPTGTRLLLHTQPLGDFLLPVCTIGGWPIVHPATPDQFQPGQTSKLLCDLEAKPHLQQGLSPFQVGPSLDTLSQR